MGEPTSILLLTDLHISNEESFEILRQKWERLFLELERKKPFPISLVVVTGDITSHGDEKEYQCAVVMLTKLLDICGLPMERLVICPGNHDADTIYKNSTFANYHSFLNTLYGEATYDAFERIMERKEQKNIHLFSMNSNTKTSLTDPNYALLSKDTVQSIISASQEEYRILLMHHQPECYEDRELFNKVCDRVDLVLCGHLHPSEPIQMKMGNAMIVVGIALTPHLSSITKGAQIIRIGENCEVLVESITIP